jgi:hypothetical protein
MPARQAKKLRETVAERLPGTRHSGIIAPATKKRHSHPLGGHMMRHLRRTDPHAPTPFTHECIDIVQIITTQKTAGTMTD